MSNLTSRVISGSVAIIIGLGLTIASVVSSYFLLIYSIPVLLIGIWLIFNKKEDKIEKIKEK